MSPIDGNLYFCSEIIPLTTKSKCVTAGGVNISKTGGPILFFSSNFEIKNVSVA